MYQVREITRTNPLTKMPKPPGFEVVAENGDLYATLRSQADAELVAYGLNHGYPQHFCGGFSDEVAEEIRRAMKEAGYA